MVLLKFGEPNHMNTKAKLTNREREVAELSAWGASKKEIADQLFISTRTVENHFRNIYYKTECIKATELSAWWFCTRFNISFSLSPFVRKIAASALLLIYLTGIYGNNFDQLRVRTSTRTLVRARSSRRKENNYKLNVA